MSKIRYKCNKCGKIHDKLYDCSITFTREKREPTEIDKFRWSRAWKCKSEEIQTRDLHLCRCCYYGIGNVIRQYNNRELSVHHIEPLVIAWERRLDNDNLITLCRHHHEQAEKGNIAPDVLVGLLNRPI